MDAIVAPLSVVASSTFIFTSSALRDVRSVCAEELLLFERDPPAPVGVNPLVERLKLFEFELLEAVFWTEDTSRLFVLILSCWLACRFAPFMVVVSWVFIFMVSAWSKELVCWSCVLVDCAVSADVLVVTPPYTS